MKFVSFDNRNVFIICLLLIAATFVVYGQVGGHKFINLDDRVYVTENNNVQAGVTPESITWAFTATRASNWHPLTWLSHILDFQLFGLNAGWHHLINVLFHIANTLLLFFVLRGMTGALWRSGFVAALFALHPLHVESVAWVSERKDVLSTFFWILTMWGYAGYVRRPGIKRYLLVLLLFALGLMAKPMLVTLPFVLLLLDYWPLGRLQPGSSLNGSRSEQRSLGLKLILEKIPLFFLSAGSSVATFMVQKSGGAVASLDSMPLSARVANALVSYVSYLGKMFWPYHLAVPYPLRAELPGWHVAGSSALLLAITLLALRAVRRRPYLAVGWLWYLGTLVPVIGLVHIGSQAMADRYTYVPLVGIFVVIAWGISELAAGWRYRKIGLTALGSVVLAILMVTSWHQVGYWKSSVTLLERSISVNPNNPVASMNLGHALIAGGKLEQGIDQFSEALGSIHKDRKAPGGQGKSHGGMKHISKALRSDPDFQDQLNLLGVARFKEGKIKEAASYYRAALRIKPDYAAAHYNLGLALAAQGKLDEAISHYSEALRLDPDFAQVHNNLGIALFRKGDLEEAVVNFREALRIKPDFAEASRNLQVALERQKESQGYVAKSQKGSELQSGDPVLHYKLANFYIAEGKINEAIEEYEKVLSIQPGFTDAMNNLALLYVGRGQHEKALPLYMKLIELEPESYVPYYNLACMYARQNKVEQSIDWLREAVGKGFKDWDHLKSDEDLENIRSTSYFRELAQRAKKQS